MTQKTEEVIAVARNEKEKRKRKRKETITFNYLMANFILTTTWVERSRMLSSEFFWK